MALGYVKVKKGRPRLRGRVVNGIPSHLQLYGVSLAAWDHTVYYGGAENAGREIDRPIS